MESLYFYCYSERLMYFLLALGFNYAFKGENSRTHGAYMAFNKSERLDNALGEWDTIKNKFYKFKEN